MAFESRLMRGLRSGSNRVDWTRSRAASRRAPRRTGPGEGRCRRDRCRARPDRGAARTPRARPSRRSRRASPRMPASSCSGRSSRTRASSKAAGGASPGIAPRGEQAVVRGVRAPEARERAVQRLRVGERAAAAPHASQRQDQPAAALLEQRVDDRRLVAEVVVDGRRGVAAARRKAPDRERLEAAVEHDRFARVEDRAPRFLALAGTSAQIAG